MPVTLAAWAASAACVAALAAAGCGAGDGAGEEVGKTAEPLTAYCDANVVGTGNVPTETDYLPHVIQCENGGAPYEALLVQAITARTYLYYKMETSGSVADGTGDQVFSCGKTPTADHEKAALDTAGLVLRYNSVTICSFFVAGGAGTAPGCVGSASASTEHFVTYNEGKSGADVEQTSLGWVSPTNDRNRGCASQNGASCLSGAGKKFDEILRFYYGADIGIEKATGPCVPQPVDAGTDDAGSDAEPPVDASPKADADAAQRDAGDEWEPGPDPGGDAGCACRASPRGAGGALPLGVALGIAAAGARRRRRPA